MDTTAQSPTANDATESPYARWADIFARRNLSTRMRQRWFEFKESPRRRWAPALVG